MFGKTVFKVKGLNVEKNLSSLSKKIPLFDITRIEKNQTTISVNFIHRKRLKKELRSLGYEILEEKNYGFLPKILVIFFNFGTIFAIFSSLLLYFLQSSYVLQYEVIGTESLSKVEIVDYIKENFSSNVHKFNTNEIENSLYTNFDEISFVSCIVKGQTLVVNIKEKLLPEEIYGDFEPIISNFDGKITEIELISGTSVVNVGDYVNKGDVLVEPFYFDSNGVMQKVDADAKIKMEVYLTSKITHFDTRIEKVRTGNFVTLDEISLFGLNIYTSGEIPNYKLFEEEVRISNLSDNNILPFRLKRTIFYELENTIVNEKFEDKKEEIIKKAREKVLEKIENCDTIVDEFHTLKHFQEGVIVEYVVVVEKLLD